MTYRVEIRWFDGDGQPSEWDADPRDYLTRVAAEAAARQLEARNSIAFVECDVRIVEVR